MILFAGLFIVKKTIKKMTTPNHFPIENIKHNEKEKRFYRPRIFKVLFSLSLIFFVAQGCQQTSLTRYQTNRAWKMPNTALSQGQINGLTSRNSDRTIFARKFNESVSFDHKASEIDGTLVVKAFDESGGELFF